MTEENILMDQTLMRWAGTWMGEQAVLKHFAKVASAARPRSPHGSVDSHIYGKCGVLYHMFTVLQLSKLKKMFTPTNPHTARFWKKRKVLLRDTNTFDFREYMLYYGD